MSATRPCELKKPKEQATASARSKESKNSPPPNRKKAEDKQRDEENSVTRNKAVYPREWQEQCERRNKQSEKMDNPKDSGGDENDKSNLQWWQPQGEYQDASYEARQLGQILNLLRELENTKRVNVRIDAGHKRKRVGRGDPHFKTPWREQSHACDDA